MKKSEIEIAWAEYRNSTDNELIINAKTYYKFVYKDELIIPGKGQFFNVFIPNKSFPKYSDYIIYDEFGNKLSLKGPAFIRFGCEIPDWYFEVGSYFIDKSNNELIGNYITFVQE